MEELHVPSSTASTTEVTCCPPGTGPRDRGVRVVPGESVLAVAIAAGLRARGWPVAAGSVPAPRSAPEGHPGTPSSTSHLILVASAEGDVPDPLSMPGLHPVVVAVGGHQSLTSLARAVERGATGFVDSDQPFTTVIDAIEEWLLGHRCRTASPAQAALLRRHAQKSARFAELSQMEQVVLGDLVLGMSAAEIAAARQLSVSTIRTHIRGILRQLDVSSQGAAVALAHRYCREPEVLAQLRRLHHL